MEPIGNECEVGMGEPDDIAKNGLNSVSRVEQNFDPSIVLENNNLPDLALGSQRVIKWPAQLSLVENADVDSAIQKASL